MQVECRRLITGREEEGCRVCMRIVTHLIPLSAAREALGGWGLWHAENVHLLCKLQAAWLSVLLPLQHSAPARNTRCSGPRTDHTSIEVPGSFTYSRVADLATRGPVLLLQRFYTSDWKNNPHPTAAGEDRFPGAFLLLAIATHINQTKYNKTTPLTGQCVNQANHP